jgi:hypothetical protein
LAIGAVLAMVIPSSEYVAQQLPADAAACEALCFTKRQLQTIKDIYRGPYDSKGVQILKGLSLGSEFAWPLNILPHKANNLFPTHLGYEVDHVNYLFYDKSPGSPMPVPNDLNRCRTKGHFRRNSRGGNSTSTM